MIYSDRTLSQKLERTEARANADFVETRARVSPESGATWIEIAGAYAMFDGIGSPLTQTFGLGVFEEATDDHLEELERFFKERGAEVFHEVSPMADPALMTLLSERGYRPIELTSVMYCELELDAQPSDGSEVPPSGDRSKIEGRVNAELRTRIIDKSEADLWADTAAAGWSTEGEGLADFVRGFGSIAARTTGGHPFLAELDGRPIAAGGFQMYGDVCVLAGSSTVPDARCKGAQNALLRARLQFARDSGCSFAMICALPGSQSQKNAQKNGFYIAYTRTKWRLHI